MLSIDQKYAELRGEAGVLGKPTSMEAVCPDKVGRYRHYENGSIYWHPDIGAYEVHGFIHQKWDKLGWEKSVLGYPMSDESVAMLTTQRPAGGRYNLFQHGVILYKDGATEAFEVHGPILGKYREHKSEKGILGFPISDEQWHVDSFGRVNHFEHGSIFWTPRTGAHELHGLIYDFVVRKGGGLRYGYPYSDVLSTDSGNQYCDCADAVIYLRKGTQKAILLNPEPFLHRYGLGLWDECTRSLQHILHYGEMVGVANSLSQGGELTAIDWNGSLQVTETGIRWLDLQYSVYNDLFECHHLSCVFTIEINYDRHSRKIQIILRNCQVGYSGVQFHGIEGMKQIPIPPPEAAAINVRLIPVLEPLVGKPFREVIIPAHFNVLTMRIAGHGDMDFYVEPPEVPRDLVRASQRVRNH